MTTSSREDKTPAAVPLDHLRLDGRPVERRPEDLNTMTLDERDNGLYRHQLSIPRSTYDPFQANMGEVSLAEGMVSARTRRRHRLGIWFFLILPCAMLGYMGTVMAWDSPMEGLLDVGKALLSTLLYWLPAAYWLYLMYRRPPRKS